MRGALLVEPHVGQVLIEIVAGAYLPALHVRAQRNVAHSKTDALIDRLIWKSNFFDATSAGVEFRHKENLRAIMHPLEAIAESAKLLRDLRREFGNLGLAAAYNAGSGRARLARW